MNEFATTFGTDSIEMALSRTVKAALDELKLGRVVTSSIHINHTQERVHIKVGIAVDPKEVGREIDNLTRSDVFDFEKLANFASAKEAIAFIARTAKSILVNLASEERRMIGAHCMMDKPEYKWATRPEDAYGEYIRNKVVEVVLETASFKEIVRRLSFDLEMANSAGKQSVADMKKVFELAVEAAADLLMDNGVIHTSADLVAVCEKIKALKMSDQRAAWTKT